MASKHKRKAGVLARLTPRSWHQALATFALILFAFQNYVTQTHIHLLWQGTPDAFVKAIGAVQFDKSDSGKKAPADNPANCPICQDLALAGHYTTPVVLPLLAPDFVVVAVRAFALRIATVTPPSHNWYGRAPPRR